jgi:hypothetical protein
VEITGARPLADANVNSGESGQRSMDLFYRFFSSYFPEVLVLETGRERRKALWQARLKSPRWLSLFLLLIPAVALVMWTQAFGVFGLTSRAARTGLAGLVGGVLGALLGPLLEFLLHHRRIQQALREVLVKQEIAVCLGCGYDLRGQTEPRCPECGQPFADSPLTTRTFAE